MFVPPVQPPFLVRYYGKCYTTPLGLMTPLAKMTIHLDYMWELFFSETAAGYFDRHQWNNLMVDVIAFNLRPNSSQYGDPKLHMKEFKAEFKVRLQDLFEAFNV